MKKSNYFLLLFLFPAAAFAHCTKSDYYGGGGVAINTLEHYSSATGFQFIGGLCLKQNFGNKKVKTSLEAGYLDTGNFKSGDASESFQGMWSAALVEYKSNPSVHFLGRAGYDFGDDKGLMFGVGMAVNISRFAQIRTEFINRDETNSVQMNLITEFQ